MGRDNTYDLPGPHWDAEWDCFRGNIRYWLTLPSNGIDQNTGLIFFIPGYGMEGDSDYVQKFRAFASDKYNCCVASITSKENYLEPKFRVAPDFFEKLKEHHDVREINITGIANTTENLLSILNALNQRGVKFLNPECKIFYGNDEYFSFGVIPAINVLTVLHDILKRQPLDKKRLFCLGSSYGGYVASMVLKFAPNTFRMLIDNSGFVNADDRIVYHFDGSSFSGVGDLLFRLMCTKHWSSDPVSPQFFSQSCREIRDLLRSDHVRNSDSVMYSYHARADKFIDVSKKLKLNEVYQGKIRYYQTIIEEGDIDGRLFKTFEHGMDASLRGLFELSYDKFQSSVDSASDATDFDLRSVIELPCTGETYITYFDDEGIELVIQ